ncbi:hypothetical protein [Caballeronia ptereochthonis]|uniref:Phage tail assembly protein n=1 Tax=Caballeronia ptereochthonis TaxID=1777144 RepID=A0A158DZP5_9BURK|nr:hypothetical protein [Caballeronia ptereochthonis]SAK99686.1 hypothetical protein AWB83_06124 [Caballeronia ptereochthonis]
MNQALPARFLTESEFVLPRGYIDAAGVLHRHGAMRLATAGDEILPLRDPRVQQNAAYLAVIVLSRVIVRLGSMQDIDVKVIEGLFAADFDYLQRLYERFNAGEEESAPRERDDVADDDAGSALRQERRALGEV